LTVHLGTILADNQLYVLPLMYLFILPFYMFRTAVFIIMKSIVLIYHLVCISLCRWLLGMPDRHTKQSPTYTNTYQM